MKLLNEEISTEQKGMPLVPHPFEVDLRVLR